jgi:hypothetical protein
LKTRTIGTALSILFLLFLAWTGLPAIAQAPAKLGKVIFPVSCTAAAQKEFEVSMAYYHSFAWPEHKASLERVIAADPACGMAHWGRALGLLDNPFQWPGSLSPKIMADGQAAIDAARAAGLRTPRERDYVEALAIFFKDADKLNHRTSTLRALAITFFWQRQITPQTLRNIVMPRSMPVAMLTPAGDLK